MTRVALLTNFIPPYRVPVLRELAKRVDKLTTFVSTPMEPNRPWPAQWDGLDVRVQRTITLRRPWRHPYGFRDDLYIHVPYDTVPLLARYKPDLILSAEMGARTVQAVVTRAFVPKARVVLWATLSEHTEAGRGASRTHLRRWLLRQVDAVIVNGESGARYIRSLSLSDNRIRKVPQTTGVEEFFAQPLQRTEKTARRILYSGRLIELKNIYGFSVTLRRWADQHPNEEVSFWLVGDGPERQRIRGLDWPPNVEIRFFGHVPYADLPKIYAEAGILVLPTHVDEWGLVVNEAMAAGLPVLGSTHSQAVDELVTDAKTGWMFNPHDEAQMYAALSRALATPLDQLQAMRVNSRERLRLLTPSAVADSLLRAAICD